MIVIDGTSEEKMQEKITKILSELGDYNEIEKNLKVCKQLHNLKKSDEKNFVKALTHNSKFTEFVDKCKMIVLNDNLDIALTLYCKKHKIDKIKLVDASNEFDNYVRKSK